MKRLPADLPLDALALALWVRGRAGEDVTGVIQHSGAGAQGLACSVMSVSHSRFVSSAVNRPRTKSSNAGGPGRLPLPCRWRCAADRIPSCEHNAHAVRRDVRHPALRASLARNRYPNSGSFRCASTSALRRCARSHVAFATGRDDYSIASTPDARAQVPDTSP